jgi:hypothetical protein
MIIDKRKEKLIEHIRHLEEIQTLSKQFKENEKLLLQG